MIQFSRFIISLIFVLFYVHLGLVNAQTATDDRHSITFPDGEIASYLLDFTDNDCRLPCFAGIQPGVTTLTELQRFSQILFRGDEKLLAEFDQPFVRMDGWFDYTFRFAPWDDPGFFDFSFIVSQEEILEQFRSQLGRPASWLGIDVLYISNIFEILGEPNEIYIAIAASQPPKFEIALAYEELGTLIIYRYGFDPGQLTQGEEPIQLCGTWEDTDSIKFWIQAIDDEAYAALLEEALPAYEFPDGRVNRGFWPLNRMTDMEIDPLIQLLSENHEWCFDALSYEELWEAGYSY